MARRVLGTDWKTTATGLVAIALGVALLYIAKTPEERVAGLGVATVGLGLIKAKDA